GTSPAILPERSGFPVGGLPVVIFPPDRRRRLKFGCRRERSVSVIEPEARDFSGGLARGPFCGRFER
ncbi:unnamed protein product, partial [Callosobruchus maculatus]